MKRLLAVALLLLVTLAAAGFGYDDSDLWVALHERLTKSTARLTHVAHDQEAGSCSTFSINEQRRYWMTAFHCLGSEMFIDGQIAWIIYKNETHDLAVLESPGRSAPALRLADEDVRVGDPVAALGYGYGFAIPQFRQGVASLLNLPGSNIDILNAKTTVHVFDLSVMGGMSGSAVVNADGDVVSVVHLEEGGRSGLGRPLATIRTHTQQFFD